MKVILGLQEAHDASAALMIDGEIVAAAQEERFTGLKGDYGYPEKSIAYCLNEAGLQPSQIDEVVLASHRWNPVLTKIRRNANFSVDDWVEEQHRFWRPRIFENRDISLYEIFQDRKNFKYDTTYPMDHLLKGYMDQMEMKQMSEIRKQTVSSRLRIPRDRVRTITHEDCHTFYAYFGSPMRGTVLALTSEGIGDYSNGTVSEFSESGRKQLTYTVENHLGHIYQYITLLLGMKPAQHEYKVMGLAPYANMRELDKSYKIFERLLKIDGLKIVYDEKPKDLYFHFRDALEGHRFDGIAGAVQKFVELTLCRWITACVKATGLSRICFAGGVAQNIKACKSIMELDGVENIYVCPSPGDTSLSIGACYYAMWEHCQDHKLPVEMIKSLDNIYLGPAVLDDAVKAIIERKDLSSKFKVTRGVVPEEVARRLSQGEIIARCCDRMEFGQRALGNRSILADPRRPEVIQKINSAIKFRDFWMPFAPTILAGCEKDYIINPKKVKCPYMTIAFESTQLARKDLLASLHPADFSVRPQILEEKKNPKFAAIIQEFKNLTGVGGVLNTSFNLHENPIVLGPEEAIYTFENSELDALILGDYLLTR
jgi:carbamoyltransferase